MKRSQLTNMKSQINFSIADVISIGALFLAWLSCIYILNYKPYYAIFTMLGALTLDVTDGYLARKLKKSSTIGCELDSYVDVFTYLVFSALFFHSFLSPHVISSLIVGFLILTFGGLRLIRFNKEGILQLNDKKYYRGVTVVHIAIFTIISYFAAEITGRQIVPILSSIILILLSLAMLSDYKSYKLSLPLLVILIVILAFAGIYLYLQNGY